MRALADALTPALMPALSEIYSIVTVAFGSCFCKSAVADLIAALAEAAVDTTLAPEIDPAVLPTSESVS